MPGFRPPVPRLPRRGRGVGSLLKTSGRRRVAAFATFAIVVTSALALPAVVGGHTSVSLGPLPASAFRALAPTGSVEGISAGPADTGAALARFLDVASIDGSRPDPGRLEPGAALVEPALLPSPTSRPAVIVPLSTPGVEVVATPRPTPRPILRSAPLPTPPLTQAAVGTISTGGRILTGWASWYDNGTTAMRLPRGTRVRICGPATCVTRIVDDYGPDASVFPDRIVDMMPTDFASVCGCSPSRGTVRVTVTILS